MKNVVAKQFELPEYADSNYYISYWSNLIENQMKKEIFSDSNETKNIQYYLDQCKILNITITNETKEKMKELIAAKNKENLTNQKRTFAIAHLNPHFFGNYFGRKKTINVRSSHQKKKI